LNEEVLVKEVHGEFIRREIIDGETEFAILDTRITCVLEDNRVFYLERVPPEIIFSLKKLEGEDLNDDRERFVDIIASMPEVVEIIGRYLKRVVIDEFDETRGVYSATVEFADGDIVLKRKMVPSHAIFLARLTNKPIYIRKKLVDQQEELLKLLEGSDPLGPDADEDEEYGEEYEPDESGNDEKY
jgi:bifunctional DNase/RNase